MFTAAALARAGVGRQCHPWTTESSGLQADPVSVLNERDEFLAVVFRTLNSCTSCAVQQSLIVG
eukprot:4451093-Pleurochrysis_carterae.AAC.1